MGFLLFAFISDQQPQSANELARLEQVHINSNDFSTKLLPQSFLQLNLTSAVMLLWLCIPNVDLQLLFIQIVDILQVLILFDIKGLRDSRFEHLLERFLTLNVSLN